jgi:pimeloyl-ACP methyl ester carboxylesterase
MLAASPPPIPPAQLRPSLAARNLVREWTITYRAHDGLPRRALVLLPRWYGPKRDPAVPLVISPHGRGVRAQTNARLWGNLPAVGRFAVVNPEGQGRRLTLFSWGDPGEIADLARMPRILHRTLPWLHVERKRVFAIGSSMGGQETLLLLARYPKLLAGAAAFDSATNLAARYEAFRFLPFGIDVQRLARVEVGGTPSSNPHAWAVRSPLDWARRLAWSHVPLQIWWSWKDRIVVDQNEESGALYRRIKRLDPSAPVVEFVGDWAHSAEFKASRRLPFALSLFGLMPPFRPTPPAPPGGAASS